MERSKFDAAQKIQWEIRDCEKVLEELEGDTTDEMRLSTKDGVYDIMVKKSVIAKAVALSVKQRIKELEAEFEAI